VTANNTPSNSHAAIVLAAGRSSRFGASNKLLHPYDGLPLIRHAIRPLADLGLLEIVVVTGHDATGIRDALAGLDVQFAHNPCHETGMASSIQAGIDAISANAASAFLVLGDMPAVSQDVYRTLLQTLASKDVDVVVPVVDNHWGHPKLFMRGMFDQLRSLIGDVGAREILTTGNLKIATCDVDDHGILFDVDTTLAANEPGANTKRPDAG